VALKEKLKQQLHFGRTLEESFKTAMEDGREHCVDVALKSLHKKEALTAEGIIRIPGAKPSIYAQKDQFDAGISVNLENEDPFVVAGLFKLYLYSLPDSLFPQKAFQDAKELEFESDNIEETIKQMKFIIDKIPDLNRKLLCKVMQYFITLSQYSDINKMDARAISISIGPSIVIAPDIREDPHQFVNATKIAPALVQFMMAHAKQLGLNEVVDQTTEHQNNIIRDNEPTISENNQRLVAAEKGNLKEEKVDTKE